MHEAAAFGALLMYVTAVHAVLFSEARYAMPAKPMVVLLATVAGRSSSVEDSEPIVLTVGAAGQRWLVLRTGYRPLSHKPLADRSVPGYLRTPGSGRPLG